MASSDSENPRGVVTGKIEWIKLCLAPYFYKQRDRFKMGK